MLLEKALQGHDAVLGEERRHRRIQETVGAAYLVAFPRSARGYYLLGVWRMQPLGLHEEAAAAFRQAVRLDPGYMPASRAAEAMPAPQQAPASSQ